MLCNMDKNEVLRSFNLKHVALNDEQPEVTTAVLSMRSYYSGEYGGVIFEIEAEMESEFGRVYGSFVQTSASSLRFLHTVREFETRYFMSQVVPLFYPLKLISDEVQKSSSSESQDA